MSREELLARTSIDPNVCFGKPCLRGHRIWVSLVLDFLASGWTIHEVMENYHLTGADVLACIAYGAEMARERFVDIPLSRSARGSGMMNLRWRPGAPLRADAPAEAS